MGKLTIEGKATKNYEYNVMEITVSFNAYETSYNEAIDKVTGQCEEFLSILNAQGFSMDTIHIGNDSINQGYDEGDLYVIIAREIIIKRPFDVGFSNYLMELIKDKGYEVALHIEPLMTNYGEIKKDLLKLAIEDSKSKATFIADAMEQKIIGIDSVEIGHRYDSHKFDDTLFEQEREYVAPSRLRLSNQLKAPTTTETQTVEVVWIIK